MPPKQSKREMPPRRSGCIISDNPFASYRACFKGPPQGVKGENVRKVLAQRGKLKCIGRYSGLWAGRSLLRIWPACKAN